MMHSAETFMQDSALWIYISFQVHFNVNLNFIHICYIIGL